MRFLCPCRRQAGRIGDCYGGEEKVEKWEPTSGPSCQPGDQDDRLQSGVTAGREDRSLCRNIYILSPNSSIFFLKLLEQLVIRRDTGFLLAEERPRSITVGGRHAEVPFWSPRPACPCVLRPAAPPAPSSRTQQQLQPLSRASNPLRVTGRTGFEPNW